MAKVKNKQLEASTAAVQKASLRLVRHTIAAAVNPANIPAVVVKPSVSLGIETRRSPKMYFNNTYGILPFAMSASKDELAQAVEQLELQKYTLMAQGDYYYSWLAGQRQRILLGVLTGMTTFKLERL